MFVRGKRKKERMVERKEGRGRERKKELPITDNIQVKSIFIYLEISQWF